MCAQTKIVMHYLGLSFLYTVNNQLSFYCLEVADPGSMALGKSIAPYLCALLLTFTGQLLHSLQWVCVIVQCCAIAIVQYDACAGTGYLPLKAYYMIAAATSITAVTSVWNQLIIKGFEVPVNLQVHAMKPSYTRRACAAGRPVSLRAWPSPFAPPRCRASLALSHFVSAARACVHVRTPSCMPSAR